MWDVVYSTLTGVGAVCFTNWDSVTESLWTRD
jgi:hypothetical protein